MNRRWALIAVVALAACNPSASDSPSPSEPASSAEPAASEAASPSQDIASGTITIVDAGVVDGPGVSITEALENAGADPLLVNGILLQDAEGTIWLCESLSDTSPPACADAQLLVENYPADAAENTFDPDNADVTGLQVEDGVGWIEDNQLYGTVTAD